MQRMILFQVDCIAPIPNGWIEIRSPTDYIKIPELNVIKAEPFLAQDLHSCLRDLSLIYKSGIQSITKEQFTCACYQMYYWID